LGRWYLLRKFSIRDYIRINQDDHTNTPQNGDGSRQPSQKELEVATAQGKAFYEAVAKVNFQ